MQTHKLALLDTHVFLWLMLGDATLNSKVTSQIESYVSTGKVLISAISLWEISALVKRKRIIFGVPCLQWLEEATQLPGIEVVPLTPHIAVDSEFLPEGLSTGDPADKIIIATARRHQATLFTRDEAILRYAKMGSLKAIKA